MPTSQDARTFTSKTVVACTELYKKPWACLNSKTVFMPVGKVASLSIRDSIADKMIPITKDKMVLTYKNYKAVAVVRHPLERLVSAFQYFTYVNKKYGYDLGFEWNDFVDWVYGVAAEPDDATNLHMRSQLALLSHNNKLLPDVVIPYHRIEEVKDHLPIPRLKYNERTKTHHAAWRTYYSPKLRAIAEKRYAADLETWGDLFLL